MYIYMFICINIHTCIHITQTYVRNKVKACEECDIKSIKHEITDEATNEEILALLHTLNCDPAVHAILVSAFCHEL